jgi:hypothetical protein
MRNANTAYVYLWSEGVLVKFVMTEVCVDYVFRYFTNLVGIE